MVLGLGALVGLASACAEAPPIAHRATVPDGSFVARARAYERGAGVPRDYRDAAEIYRTACDGGAAAACDELLHAQLASRGVTFDQPAIHGFARRRCDAHQALYPCLIATLLENDEHAHVAAVAAVYAALRADPAVCNAAAPGPCYAALLADQLSLVDSVDLPARPRDDEVRACAADIVDACVALVQRAARQDANAAESFLPPLPADPSATASSAVVVEARHRLQRACDAGDADACAAAPDRAPIPAAQLCAAFDYGACAELGCHGDDAAAALARRNGVTEHRCATAAER